MNWSRIGLTSSSIIAVLSILLAGSTAWLVLTDPVAVADAVNQGTIVPVARQLAAALLSALRDLMAYL